MTNYEIMFIVKSTIEETELKKTVDDVKNLIDNKISKVVEFKDMGRKRLAYPIKKDIAGFYYLMEVVADHDTITEFNRKVSINENILRHLIIKMESE
ncbi:MAG: 30S ribosomal protein S6 [Bacilli bacterium]